MTADVTAGNSTAAFNIDYSGIAAMNQAIDAMGDLGNLEPGWGASPCPQVVAEMPILEVGGNVNLYAFHFGPGGYVKWTVQATVTACDTIRVTSPEPTTLEVPIKIAGTVT
ncbi:MAG: hypothetical protein ACE5HT_17395, partial [Gemmatimonadales bacterium]